MRCVTRLALLVVALSLGIVGSRAALSANSVGHRHHEHHHDPTPIPTTGPWSHPTIERLSNASYTDELLLYKRRAVGASQARPQLAFKSAAEATAEDKPAARVLVTWNVSNWQYIEFAAEDGWHPTSYDAYYSVGYAEGWLTFDGIFSTWVNQVAQSAQQLQQSPKAQQFVNETIAFMDGHEWETDYGKQLRRQRFLLDGMADGWAARYADLGAPANVTAFLGRTELFLLSYMEELLNVLTLFPPPASSSAGAPKPANGLLPDSKARQHCSALVRLTKDDVFLAHDTWGMYNTMLRQYKTYRFGERFVAMSSYPGSISSIDDFYVTWHDLAITETTNGILNATLLQRMSPKTTSEYNRVMIASFIAETPKRWMEHYAFENSGTYNNQWMVLDTTLAKAALDAKAALPAGTFYVGEQIPGLVVYEDQTHVLNSKGFWASYNIPFYPKVYELSGFAAANTPQSAGFYSYTNYSRAVIFDRLHSQVTDDASMWYTMRYNDWQTDPASLIPWCARNGGSFDCDRLRSAGLTIAARFDLAPHDGAKVGPPSLAPNVNRGLFGAIDTKMTSVRMVKEQRYAAIIVNGPTAVQQPPFDLGDFLAENPAYGPLWRGVAWRFDWAPIRVSRP